MDHLLMEHRRRLDALDADLLELLCRRLDLCVEIARVKASHEIPMMQPGRVGVVLERARQFATDHGMSPAYTEGLYTAIIAETCRVETDVMAAETGERAQVSR